MFGVSFRIASIWVVLSASSSVRAGLFCDVQIATPEWYEAEYESVSVSIHVSTTTKTIVHDLPSSSPKHSLNIFISDYGNSRFPPQPFVQTTEILDSDGTEHTLSMSFNGTSVCIAFNHDQATAAGGVTSQCVRACAEAFQGDGQWDQQIYYTDETTDTKIYDYLLIKTEHTGEYQVSVFCYTREEPYSDADPPTDKFPGSLDYCPLGEKCTVTVAQKDATSPTLYYAGCQPNNTDLCAQQGCRNNSQAPYIGEGMYDSVCDWCCGFAQCNDGRNCTGDACYFYGEPRNLTNAADDNKDDKDNTNRAAVTCSIDILYFLLTLCTGILTTGVSTVGL